MYNKPSKVQGLRRFLGMVNFYRRNIPEAADIQRRLQVIIKSNRKRDRMPLEWTEDAEETFEQFKQALANCAICWRI